MAEHSTRTVVVEVKYVSSTNLVTHTENCKLDIPLNCSVKELEKTLIWMFLVAKRKGFTDFSVDIFYIDLVEPGHARKAPFVLRTQEQLEMFKKSESKSLSVKVIQQVVTFEKGSVNILVKHSLEDDTTDPSEAKPPCPPPPPAESTK